MYSELLADMEGIEPNDRKTGEKTVMVYCTIRVRCGAISQVRFWSGRLSNFYSTIRRSACLLRLGLCVAGLNSR